MMRVDSYELWNRKRRQECLRLCVPHVVTKFVRKNESELRAKSSPTDGFVQDLSGIQEFFGVDDGQMYQTLELAKRLE